MKVKVQSYKLHDDLERSYTKEVTLCFTYIAWIRMSHNTYYMRSMKGFVATTPLEDPLHITSFNKVLLS